MLDPLLHELMLADLELSRERSNGQQRRRRAREASLSMPHEAVTLRLDTVRDQEALERLAQLAGKRRPPLGRHVLAEVGGEVVAALPLLGGDPYADPFRHTAHVLPLLRLRAEQVDGTRPPSRRRLRLLRSARA